MQLDTKKTIYICLDGENGDVKVLTPKDCPLEIVELNLADRDPESTDSAEYQLLKTEMEETTYNL
jgi:hypothetical protein